MKRTTILALLVLALALLALAAVACGSGSTSNPTPEPTVTLAPEPTPTPGLVGGEILFPFPLPQTNAELDEELKLPKEVANYSWEEKALFLVARRQLSGEWNVYTSRVLFSRACGDVSESVPDGCFFILSGSKADFLDLQKQTMEAVITLFGNRLDPLDPGKPDLRYIPVKAWLNGEEITDWETVMPKDPVERERRWREIRLDYTPWGEVPTP